jgi:hypothetical protein
MSVSNIGSFRAQNGILFDSELSGIDNFSSH